MKKQQQQQWSESQQATIHRGSIKPDVLRCHENIKTLTIKLTSCATSKRNRVEGTWAVNGDYQRTA